MKDNIVQELLLRALLNKQKSTQQPTAITQAQPLSNMQNGDRELLGTLLKSLYLNNAQKQGSSNVNNVKNMTTQQMPQMQIPKENTAPQAQVFEEFMKNDPDFFKGREMLFDYLSQSGANCDTQELQKIAQLARYLEEEAIKRFCAKNPKYAQYLEQENLKTLNRLENTANSGVEGDLKAQGLFSADEISSMSNKEFLKHESEIDAQLKALLSNR